jgi:hypothetical protein
LLSAGDLGLFHYLIKDTAIAGSSSSGEGGKGEGAAVASAADGQAVNLQHAQRTTAAQDVLAAMACCLLSADDPAHVKLLSAEDLQAVERAQQEGLRAAGIAVVADQTGTTDASAMGDLQTSTAPAAAAAGAAAAGRGAGSDWSRLREQLLQLTGEAARKQLLQVLKDDYKAIKAAMQQLQALGHSTPEEAITLAGQGSTSAGCCCHWCCSQRYSGSNGDDCTDQQVVAAAGVREYLTGQLQVLDEWLGLLRSKRKQGADAPSRRQSEGSKQKKNKSKQT